MYSIHGFNFTSDEITDSMVLLDLLRRDLSECLPGYILNWDKFKIVSDDWMDFFRSCLSDKVDTIPERQRVFSRLVKYTTELDDESMDYSVDDDCYLSNIVMLSYLLDGISTVEEVIYMKRTAVPKLINDLRLFVDNLNEITEFNLNAKPVIESLMQLSNLKKYITDVPESKHVLTPSSNSKDNTSIINNLFSQLNILLPNGRYKEVDTLKVKPSLKEISSNRYIELDSGQLIPININYSNSWNGYPLNSDFVTFRMAQHKDNTIQLEALPASKLGL